MRFSVLLPTRNGGPFLRDCIISILEEPYQDMELVISDNANIDGTQEVVKSFGAEKRLKVIRSDKVVNVTENWNRAFHACSGDYILMIGDDDCLLPGYFKRMEELLLKYNDPDCVTYNAYTFVTRGSIRNNQKCYYSKQHFKFGPDFKKEGLLSSQKRFSIVRDMYRFKVRIPLNMQTTLVSRKAAMRIRGGIFQPPFPDHYALNALLLNAERWIYVQENLLVIGVSSKSFGHFVYDHQKQKGLDYLGIGSDFKGRLPGNELVNNMHVWLSLLKENYPDKLKRIQISRPNYVRRQVYYWYMQYKCKVLSRSALFETLRTLSPRDSFGLFLCIFDRESWTRLWRALTDRRADQIQRAWHGLCPIDNVSTILEFRDWVIKNRISE